GSATVHHPSFSLHQHATLPLYSFHTHGNSCYPVARYNPRMLTMFVEFELSLPLSNTIMQGTGISVFYPREDMVDQGYTTFGYMMMQMAVAHGGRCDERVVFGEGGAEYIRGLSKNRHGYVTSSRPASINKAVRMAYQLMGQIIQDKTDEVSEGEKRKGEGDRGGREKKVRIPLEGKTLVIEGNRNNSQLKIVSCIKARKYIENGCELFLAQVTKQVEFRIDLIPGAATVARAPYRLAPSKIKELSEQLKELSEK
nr:ATP-dependent zinc metalloprotease FTSH 12, chloroplastic [Tanacetum cinerariifolium]